MKNKVKKVLCGLAIAFCVTANAAPVFADTVTFDITVPGDIKSKKIEKADYEQNFYVTGTYFSKSGTLSCMSFQYNNPRICSDIARITPTATRDDAAYNSFAKPGVYYYMTTTSSVNNLHVKGRYTP